MTTHQERGYDALSIVHPQVTGVEQLRQLADVGVHFDSATLDDYLPGAIFLSRFRDHIQGLDDRDRAALNVHMTKFLDERTCAGLGEFDHTGDVRSLDLLGLGVVMRSHVEGIATRQIEYERRYELHKEVFEANLSDAVNRNLVPWFAVDGLENVDRSSPWVLDVPAMARHQSRRTAAYVSLAEREVVLRETTNFMSEQHSTLHEFMHLLSIPVAEEGEKAKSWPDFGLYYFPIDGMENTQHRWLNEAMTEHMSMIVNGWERGSYEPERELLYAIIRKAGPDVGGRAIQAYFATQQTRGIDATAIKVRTYRDLSRVTEDAGLGNISQIAAATEALETDKQRDEALRALAYKLDPTSRPYDHAAEVIDIFEPRLVPA